MGGERSNRCVILAPLNKKDYVVEGAVVSWLGRSTPGRGHCVVLLGKTLYSHSASLYPGVKLATCELNAGGNHAMD